MTRTIDQIMTESGVKFGTSGARGLAVQMTDAVCFAYTLGFLQYVRQTGATFDRVAVGGDLRTDTPRIVQAVCRAVRQFGCEPLDCGFVPTPALALFGISEKIPSIMVTGSHIPEDRNGIKFHLPTGEILKQDEVEIRKQSVPLPDGMFDSRGMFLSGGTVEPVSVRDETRQRYIDRFVRALSKKVLTGMRIGFYEHSAVGRDLLCELYTKLGAKVTRLGRSETFVAVDTEAVREEDLHAARSWAFGEDLPGGPVFDSGRLPFGAILSTDGDSDRPLLFDEHGKWIRGDIAGILTARYLLADCVVTPVNSNTALEKSGWFHKVVRTKIGSPFVVEAMQNAVKAGFKRVVGYEANGGFLTAGSILIDEDHSHRPLDPLPTRDPAIVHIATLCLARSCGVSLSGLENLLPRRVAVSDRIQNFPTELAKRKIDELSLGGAETIQLVFPMFGELASVDETDGLRMTFEDQDIIHLRPSGNAPELRCYTEADTSEQAESLLQKAMSVLHSWLRQTQDGHNPYKN